MKRKNFIRTSLGALSLLPGVSAVASAGSIPDPLPGTGKKRGAQRLSLEKLKEYESWRYGMFLHYGIDTYVGNNLPEPERDKYTVDTYNPTNLDVGQWVSVARDAGFKYACLTAVLHAGFCIWPSRHTDFTVANARDKTDVVGEFTRHCREKGLKVGIYYPTLDNYHRFGNQNPGTMLHDMTYVPWYGGGKVPKKGEVLPYMTSLSQNFMTAQMDELLTDYGKIDYVFIDIPSMMGIGFRTFLYDRIARKWPETFIEINNGVGFDGVNYVPEDYWPQDLISYERSIEFGKSFAKKWWTIEGKEYYITGEVLDTLGKEWYFHEGDAPKPAKTIAENYHATRKKGLNYNLNVPPDFSGRIPRESIDRLMEIKKLIE